MATLATDLGTFPYGSNPTFEVVFSQDLGGGNRVPTNPSSAPTLDLTDGDKQTVTGLSLTDVTDADGIYTFQVPGGLIVSGSWTGRAWAGPGNGQASVDFKFKVDRTKNPGEV